LPHDAHIAGVQAGAMLAGKYRISRIIGSGGMGVVVAAHHVALDEAVAIKLLLPGSLENPDAIARFEREARVTRSPKLIRSASSIAI
jgi:eukaryotic-like serine/threonine-protein kinase